MNDLLTTIKKICADYKIVSLDRQLQIIDSLLSRNRIIDVAVLGQFKAGKSTFLNSFFERDILPAGVIPLTSVITRITYGREDKVTVFFLDNRIENISMAEVVEYVSETKNPENIKKVLWIDIELPELMPYKGLRFVDTPGLGSIFKHNSEVTEKWAPEIGVAIIAISTDRPLSESEILLIQEARKYSPDIVILLTKADLLDDSQLKEVVDYMQSSLKKAIDIDIPIFCFSAKKNKSENRNHLINKLFIPLMENFGDKFEKILQYKINSIAISCLSYLELSLSVSLKSDLERENLKSQIISEKLSLEYVRNELVLVTRSFKSQTREYVYSRLKPYIRDLNISLKNKFNSEYNTWRGNLYRISRRYEEWMDQTLKQEINKIVDIEQKYFADYLEESRKHFAFFSESFRDRLNKNIKTVLGIEIRSEEWVVEIMELRNPDISIGQASMFNIDLLWFLFPMFLFRPYFRRHFTEKINDEVYINIRRITSDLTEKISRVIDDLKNQVYHYIFNEQLTIESVLTNKKSLTAEIQESIHIIHFHLKQPELSENIISN